MSQAWYVDLLTAGLVVLWMGWTYGIIQQFGPSPALILSSVAIGIVGVLAIHGQYVSYLKIGEKIVVGRDPPVRQSSEEREEHRKR